MIASELIKLVPDAQKLMEIADKIIERNTYLGVFPMVSRGAMQIDIAIAILDASIESLQSLEDSNAAQSIEEETNRLRDQFNKVN